MSKHWIAGLLVAAVGACGPQAEPPRGGAGPRRPAADAESRPDVLIITLDTTRLDHLGFAGLGPTDTPVLDRFAENSAVFLQGWTTAPLTLPAHCSMFTGLYPASHGVRDNAVFRLGSGAVTLAERLSAAGYSTGAVVAAAVLAGGTGVEQGFAEFDDALAGGDFEMLVAERPADRVTDAALDLHQRLTRTSEPFFLWVHYFDPHAPYSPPPRYAAAARSRAQGDEALQGSTQEEVLYRAEIRFMDAEVGRLLAGVGRESRELLTVLATDHGEALGERGEPTHGFFLYGSTLDVPLLFRHPGFPPGVRRQPVSLVDLTPTVLDTVGLPVPANLDGRSLVPSCRDPALPGDGERVLLAETRRTFHEYGWAWLDAIRAGRWKLVEAPRSELFDLHSESGEGRDVFTEHPEVVDQLRAELRRSLEDCARRARGAVRQGGDPGLTERLASLGYLSTVTSPLATREGLADPKDLIHLAALRDEGLRLLAAGSFDAARRVFERVRTENPDPAPGLQLLATCRTRRAERRRDEGRRDEARTLFAEAAQLWRDLDGHRPGIAIHRYNAAMGLLAAGDRAAAIAELRLALEIDPEDAETHFQLGVALDEEGRTSDAASHLRRFLELAGERSPRAAEARGRLRQGAQDRR